MLRAKQRGVSFIEIAIGLAILGIGIAWAIPNYSAWMQNTQIRNMAESIASGLQLARVEAIKRGSQVEFVLTDLAPTLPNQNVQLGTIDSATGTNWMVRAVLPIVAGVTTYSFVTGRSGVEGSANARVQSGNAFFAGDLDVVTFDRFGRVAAANADASGPIAKICVKSAALTTGARNLEINVSNGGQIKMCDPAVTDASDPRRCLTAPPRCS
jgi:type IV fimbrial biogenesis protein FimT